MGMSECLMVFVVCACMGEYTSGELNGELYTIFSCFPFCSLFFSLFISFPFLLRFKIVFPIKNIFHLLIVGYFKIIKIYLSIHNFDYFLIYLLLFFIHPNEKKTHALDLYFRMYKGYVSTYVIKCLIIEQRW